jgi:hypothetical protein
LQKAVVDAILAARPEPDGFPTAEHAVSGSFESYVARQLYVHVRGALEENQEPPEPWLTHSDSTVRENVAMAMEVTDWTEDGGHDAAPCGAGEGGGFVPYVAFLGANHNNINNNNTYRNTTKPTHSGGGYGGGGAAAAEADDAELIGSPGGQAPTLGELLAPPMGIEVLAPPMNEPLGPSWLSTPPRASPSPTPTT